MRSIPMRQAAVFVFASLVAACSGPWNDPNPPEKPGAVTYFSNYTSQPKHLDPVKSYSAEEGLMLDQIYEPPLQYHFLKRPYELEPATAAAMPEVSFLDKNLQPLPEGHSHPAYSLVTIRLKPNTYYQPHPAFVKDEAGAYVYHFSDQAQGEKYQALADFPRTSTRTLTADDYIYQIKRMADPANKSPLLGLMAEYIDGMSEFSALVKNTRKEGEWLDLRKLEMTGLSRVDELTYSIRLKGVYPQFAYWQAMRFFAPIPWEADRFYHNPGFKDRNLTLDWNPVGTGPFMMTRNIPNREIILERNPNFRDDFYPAEGAPGDKERGFLDDAGKKLPLVDVAVFRQEKAAAPQWAKFMQGYYDRSGEGHANINTATFDQAFTVGPDGLELTPRLRGMNIVTDEEVRPSVYYTGFNMLDPVVGGYTEDKQKLRQAISIVWNDKDFIDIFYNGLGAVAQGPVPPGLFGYREGKEGVNPYVFEWDGQQARRKSVDYARQLLAEAGYPNGRHAQTGEPLVLYMDTAGSDKSPAADWMRKQLGKLNVQLEFRPTNYARFKEKMRQGNHQLFRWGWLADYPDPENFLFLLDSRQSTPKCQCDGVNTANYDRPEFDALYDKVKLLPNGPERQRLIDTMVEMVRKDSPWIWGFNVKEYYLSNEWVRNTKRHGISQGTLKYVAVEPALRRQKQQQWNQPNVLPMVAGIAGFALLVWPAVRAYRRRQTLTIKPKQ